MASRTLFLHPNDTEGIAVNHDGSTTTLNWFGAEYTYPEKRTVSDEALLSWARKNCKWSQEEHDSLNGSIVHNPFTQKLESYTLRGIDPRYYKQGQASKTDSITVPSLEEVEVVIAGTVLELSHLIHPSWTLLNLSPKLKEELLVRNYILSPEFRLLIREEVSAPVLVGSSEAVKRMSEEIPHLHKILTIDEFLKGQQ